MDKVKMIWAGDLASGIEVSGDCSADDSGIRLGQLGCMMRSKNEQRQLDNGSRLFFFSFGKCVAIVGCGERAINAKNKPWATIYSVEVPDAMRLRGALSYLVVGIRNHFKKHGFVFGASAADSALLKHIYYKNQVPEYK